MFKTNKINCVLYLLIFQIIVLVFSAIMINNTLEALNDSIVLLESIKSEVKTQYLEFLTQELSNKHVVEEMPIDYSLKLDKRFCVLGVVIGILIIMTKS